MFRIQHSVIPSRSRLSAKRMIFAALVRMPDRVLGVVERPFMAALERHTSEKKLQLGSCLLDDLPS
jgi:hypothetical protein